MTEPTGHAPEPDIPPAEEQVPLDSDALIYWAHTTLFPVIERTPRTGLLCWCPQWWEHPEAILRFDAIRRAWRGAVHPDAPGNAVSDWLLGCVDPHLRELLSPTGPFAACGWSPRHGWRHRHQPQSLPQEDPADMDRTRFPAHDLGTHTSDLRDHAEPDTEPETTGGRPGSGGGQPHARHSGRARDGPRLRR